jgi:hypothetical protein
VSRLRAAMLVAASTLLVASSWRTMMAPGPVASAHDEWAANCDSCHLVFDGVPDEKCLSCHSDLQGRIEGGVGWHAEVKGRPCIECHSDHRGLDASLTNVEALSAFDHALTGFPLTGSHGKPTCNECHTEPIGKMAGACSGCHEDAHSSALGPNCGACHEPQAWTQGLKTLTAHTLSMEGSHGSQQCDDCHTHGANLEGAVVCGDCHSEAHGGTTSGCERCHEVTGWKPAEFDHGPCTCAFPGKHQTAACLDCHEDFNWADTPTTCAGCHIGNRPHDDLGACSTCHTATSWKENLFDHNRNTSFKIVGAHEEVSCSQCHGNEGKFGGQKTACTSCHQALGDRVHGNFGPCETCHGVAGFVPSTFDHASTGFALNGRHLDLGCPDCHRPDGTLK